MGGLKAAKYVVGPAEKIVKIAELRINQYDDLKISIIPDGSGLAIGYLSLRTAYDSPTFITLVIDNVIRTLTLYKKEMSIYANVGAWCWIRVESLNGDVIPLAEETDLSLSDLTEIE